MFHAIVKMVSLCMSYLRTASPVLRSQMKTCTGHTMSKDCGRELSEAAAPTDHIVEAGRHEHVLRGRVPLDEANTALVAFEVAERFPEVRLEPYTR